MIFYKDKLGRWYKHPDMIHSVLGYNSELCTGYVRDIISYLKEIGCIVEEKEIVSPSIIDYIRMNMNMEAIKCYCEIHKSTIAKAAKMVEKIKKDMEDMKK